MNDRNGPSRRGTAPIADQVKIASSGSTSTVLARAMVESQDLEDGFLDRLDWRLSSQYRIVQDPDDEAELDMAAWVFGYRSNGHLTGTEPSPDDVQAAMVQYWWCVYDGCFTHIGRWSLLDAVDVVVHLDWAHDPVARAA